MQTDLAQKTCPLDLGKNMQVSETMQQSAKCSVIWVLGLVSLGTVALVWLPHPGHQDVFKQPFSAWLFSCGYSVRISQLWDISGHKTSLDFTRCFLYRQIIQNLAFYLIMYIRLFFFPYFTFLNIYRIISILLLKFYPASSTMCPSPYNHF